MSRLRSLSSIGKKAKDGVVPGQDDVTVTSGETKGRTSTSSWRIKKPRSASTSKRSRPPGYFASGCETPPVPTIPSSLSAGNHSSVPQLPPLSLSPHSSYSASMPSSPVTRLSGARLQAMSSSTTQDVLLPPQPAFLGGRSTSAPIVSGASNSSSLMNGSNSSRISLMSNASSLGTEATSVPLSGASNTGSLQIQQDKGKRDSSASGARLAMRALGKRFFSRPDKTANSGSKQPSPTIARPPITRSDLRSSRHQMNAQNSLPSSPMQTPPLSYQSGATSSSSCTSTGSSMPSTPSACPSPTLLAKSSFYSTSTVQVRSAGGAAAPTSASYPFTSDPKEEVESTDFLRAVLSYALADTDMLVESGSIGKQKVPAPTRPNPVEQEKKKDNLMARPAWTRQTYDDSDDDSDDDYGKEGDTNSTRAQTPRVSKTTKLRPMSIPVRRSVGLDTAAKRAVYACTIVKIYPKLSASSQSEIKVPRSINSADSLRGHHSSYSHKRSIGIGLARSLIIRRLNTESLSLKMEQELSWFVLKYLPQYIAPDQLNRHLAQKAVESSLEALARPPLVQGSENGMAVWATRKPFAQRCESISANDKIELPLKELRLQVGQVFKTTKNTAHPMPLQLSKRCQALAGPSLATKPVQFGKLQGTKMPASPSDEAKEVIASSSKSGSRLAPPWARSRANSSAKSSATSSPSISRSASPLRLEVPTVNKDKARALASDDEEEDVPLARLMQRRRSRASSECATSVAAYDEYAHRMRQQQERESVSKKQRELMLLQEQRRLLEKAREWRSTTEHAAVLSSPTYGAGNALLASKRQSKAVSEVGVSPSSRYSRSYSTQSQIGPVSSSQRTSLHGGQTQRTTSYSNASTPSLTPSPPSARIERPGRSRINSQTSAPSAWSPPRKTSAPSTSNRLSASPSMPRANSLQTLPVQHQIISPPTMIPQMIPQHAIPFQQPVSPYAMLPMTSLPSFDRQSMVIVPSYYFSPIPYHTPPSPLSYPVASQYRVDVDAAS